MNRRRFLCGVVAAAAAKLAPVAAGSSLKIGDAFRLLDAMPVGVIGYDFWASYEDAVLNGSTLSSLMADLRADLARMGFYDSPLTPHSSLLTLETPEAQ